jgi:hypothetical protein
VPRAGAVRAGTAISSRKGCRGHAVGAGAGLGPRRPLCVPNYGESQCASRRVPARATAVAQYEALAAEGLVEPSEQQGAVLQQLDSLAEQVRCLCCEPRTCATQRVCARRSFDCSTWLTLGARPQLERHQVGMRAYVREYRAWRELRLQAEEAEAARRVESSQTRLGKLRDKVAAARGMPALAPPHQLSAEELGCPPPPALPPVRPDDRWLQYARSAGAVASDSQGDTNWAGRSRVGSTCMGQSAAASRS